MLSMRDLLALRCSRKTTIIESMCHQDLSSTMFVHESDAHGENDLIKMGSGL